MDKHKHKFDGSLAHARINLYGGGFDPMGASPRCECGLTEAMHEYLRKQASDEGNTGDGK